MMAQLVKVYHYYNFTLEKKKKTERNMRKLIFSTTLPTYSKLSNQKSN